MAYSGDAGPCEGLARAAAGADVFLCEASSPIGEDMSAYGHLTPRQAATIALAAGAERLVLTHWHGVDTPEAMIDDARASGFAGPVHVGHDGDVVDVG